MAGAVDPHRAGMSRRPLWMAIAIDAGAWACVQVGAGYVVHRLPERVLAEDNWLLRQRRWERDGRFYVDIVGIRKWKGLLPEAGAVFAGGVSKRSLRGTDTGSLERLARETRRAELGHWLMIVPAPAFVALNRLLLMPFMVLYPLAVNLPCIAAQRYNRIRLTRVVRRRTRPPGGTEP